jgi:hypothetical protein
VSWPLGKTLFLRRCCQTARFRSSFSARLGSKCSPHGTEPEPHVFTLDKKTHEQSYGWSALYKGLYRSYAAGWEIEEMSCSAIFSIM